MSKALARRSTQAEAGAVAKLRKNALAQLLQEVAEADAAVVQSANKAAQLESSDEGRALLASYRVRVKDEGKKAAETWLLSQGFTESELLIAIHACMAGKDAPAYLKMANDRYLLRHRGQDGDGGGKTAKFYFNIPSAKKPSDEQRKNAKTVDLAKLGGDKD